MNHLHYANILVAIMAVLAYVFGGWLVKAVVAVCSLICFAIYVYRQRLWGLSLYLLALFLLYLCADLLTFDDISHGALLSYVIFCVTLGGCITLARQGNTKLKVFTVLTNTVFIVLPAFYLTHYVVFSAGVTRDVYHGMLQTNITEAIEFARTTGIAEHMPLPLLIIILITFLLWRYLRKSKIIITQRTQVLLLLTLVALTGWSGTSKWAPDTGPRITRDLGLYTIKYYNRLRLFKRRTAKRDISKVNYTAKKAGKGETYLIVIGESLNKHHMQIYGYPRQTTPHLANEHNLLIFRHVYSSHIHTAHALVKALTVASQYNGMEWYNAVSIVDILRKTDTKTFWISNQNLFSFFISAITLFAQQTDYHYHLGDAFYDSPHHDEVLLPHIAPVLDEDTQDNRVVFVHLMGNHADYCLRYPTEYERFQGKLPVATHGRAAEGDDMAYQRKINCYDNSVLYNDFIVNELLSMLKNRGGVDGFIYFSDHADDLLAGRAKIMHSFSYEMTSIPMVMWFSPAYRAKYPHAYQNLQNNRERLFSADMLYDTLIGLMAINTNQYTPRNDLSSSTYVLKDDEALVLNGEHKYRDNSYWQQQRQIATFSAEGLGSRVMPAQVNSIGKLKEVWRDGSRAFAVDVRHKDLCLAVGRSDMCLQEFLAHVDTSKIAKLWLNVKTSLEEARYDLAKVKTIVPQAEVVVNLADCDTHWQTLPHHDWQLSCALSAQQLQDLTAARATRLAAQLKAQGVTAIAFAGKFYQQVKTYLVPQLPADLALHVHSAAGVTELNNTAYWLEAQVQTIAFRYHSLFQLPVKQKRKTYAKKIPRP